MRVLPHYNLLAIPCGIQNEAGLASLQFASMSPTVEKSRFVHVARRSQGGAMNRKTALIAIAGSLAALGILAALVSPSGGNVRSVERIAQSTDRYTEADILAAFNAIETEFASEFEGCTLDEVRYDGEVETRHLDEMLEHRQKRQRGPHHRAIRIHDRLAGSRRGLLAERPVRGLAIGSHQALARRPMEGCRLGLLMMSPMTSEINQAHHSDPD